MTKETVTIEPSREESALGAFLAAMHENKLDGAKMRKAMLMVIELLNDANADFAGESLANHSKVAKETVMIERALVGKAMEHIPCMDGLWDELSAVLQSAPMQSEVGAHKCDGDHGGSNCGDLECWIDDASQPQPVRVSIGPYGDVEVTGGTKPWSEREGWQPVECARSHPHEKMDDMCVLRTEIARLTNKLASYPKREEWQSIKTAPKNGTKILMGHKGGSAWVFSWNKQRGGWDYVNDLYTWPTHWMKLPPPPKGTP